MEATLKLRNSSEIDDARSAVIYCFPGATSTLIQKALDVQGIVYGKLINQQHLINDSMELQKKQNHEDKPTEYSSISCQTKELRYFLFFSKNSTLLYMYYILIALLKMEILRSRILIFGLCILCV